MSSDNVVTGRIGQTIGSRWRLVRLLGEGGMAAVYEGEDGAGNKAAIKVLHPEMAASKEIRERFLREGYAANQVDHPGAVRVLEHGTSDEGTVFLVMELLSGESFGDRFKRDGIITPEAVLDLLEQLLEVMAVAHDRGIVHRDIKPDNLFLTTSGQVKVLDFGLARVHDTIPSEVRTRTGIAMGTLPYMAPEQALGRRNEIDGRTDLFAIGATALRLVSYRKVHEVQSEAELLIAMASKPTPSVASVAPQVPPHLAQVLDRSLAFARESRYAGAREMLEDVRALRRGEPPPVATRLGPVEAEKTRQAEAVARAVAALEAPAKEGKRGLGFIVGVGVAAGILGAALIAAIFWFAFGRSEPEPSSDASDRGASPPATAAVAAAKAATGPEKKAPPPPPPSSKKKKAKRE